MAIRAGQILTYANTFLVDRLQNVGPGDLTITRDKIYEVGNYKSVGVTEQPPDLSFNMEALNVSTDLEAMLNGVDPFKVTSGTEFTFDNVKQIDVVSPWKSPYGSANSAYGVAVPGLRCESASYRFGVTDNAGQTFTLRGSYLYYIPGRPEHNLWTVAASDGLAGYTVSSATAKATGIPFQKGGSGSATSTTPMVYNEGGVSVYALSVSLNGVQLARGVDYTETSGAVIITSTTTLTTGDKISVVFGRDATGASTYPQSIHHPPGIRPSAIRGRDIRVFVRVSGSPTNTGWVRWTDVQSINADWRLTLESDYELGTTRAVAVEPTDVPQVSGSVEMRSLTVDRMFQKISQVTGVSAGQIVGPGSASLMNVLISVHNPALGTQTANSGTAGQVIKTLYIPDARFTLPGYSGAANQKMNNTINFESDTGSIYAYRGLPGAGGTGIVTGSLPAELTAYGSIPNDP